MINLRRLENVRMSAKHQVSASVHHAAAGRNAFHIVRPARAVLIEEQARRTCTPHFVEHFAEVVRTVEE